MAEIEIQKQNDVTVIEQRRIRNETINLILEELSKRDEIIADLQKQIDEINNQVNK